MDRYQKKENIHTDISISDEDIYDAMKDIPGYLDITPGDFKELYRVAFHLAVKRIQTSVRAADIMTRKVIAVDKDMSLKKVAELMARNKISGVPVIRKDRKVAGVISEKDFLSRMVGKNEMTFMSVVAQCLKGKGCLAVSIREKTAKDIMTSPAVTVREDNTVYELANILTEQNINRVPVVSPDEILTGIVSRADIVRASLLKGTS